MAIRVHHDWGYTVPSTKGGTAHVPVSRYLYSYDRRIRLTSLTVDELTALVPPLRWCSSATWPHGPYLGSVGRRDATRPVGTTPCRPRKIGCCACCSAASRTLRTCSMGRIRYAQSEVTFINQAPCRPVHHGDSRRVHQRPLWMSRGWLRAIRREQCPRGELP
jgi:hypothetical protein